MALDAVHEHFGDQEQLVNNIVEEKSAFTYDDLFPSLPENEARQDNEPLDIGQWTNKMKVKSSVITQVYRVPFEERRYKDANSQRFGEQGEQAKICSDIMKQTGAHIEISSSKDQSLTILITGKEEAVQKARRHISKDLQTQASIQIPIPKEHHLFILGKNGKRLADLEFNTATKITVPRPDDNSDLIRITGTKEGIDRAKHEIQIISDEEAKKGFERLHIPKIYHPFIIGPHNQTLDEIVRETGARINIPPQSVMKDELTIAGEKEPVANAKERVLKIYEDRLRNCQSVSVEVPKNQHKYVIGQRGQGIQEILEQTGVSVEMPPPEKQSDTITLRGEQVKLGAALTMVYSKANSVKTEIMDVPSWLHKYIIGKKGANIKNLTQDLMKIQVDFLDDQIKIEGPPEDIKEVCKQLKDMTEKLKSELAYQELKINPAFHRHIIGKSGSNINRLKEETKTIINIPSDGDNDVVRIEGPLEGVASVRRTLLEMVHKMESEVTKDLHIEQRFHRALIGAKGEKIREIRDKFNQVNIAFPEPGLKSDKVSIRGPKTDVEACHKELYRMHEQMKLTNFNADVPIHKQNHKVIIGKGGANIKKIRDETNTKIDLPAESAESDVIRITGRREDVLKAKQMILEIQDGLDNVVTQEIMIPAKLHNAIIGPKGKIIRSITNECGGVTIKFPTEGSGSDKVSIRGPKEDVMKAKKTLVELSNEKQLTGFTAEVKARPEQHKFLIGKNGANIKKIRDTTGARIIFPNENDDERDTITIIGRKQDVEAAKKELCAIIDDLKNTDVITMEVDPKYHRHFVFKRGEVLREIGEEFGGVSVSFPKRSEANSNVVTLKGAKDYLEPAKQRILEIVKELEEMVTHECIIPQEHHRIVLGSRGMKVQNIQQEFNVIIKFPERQDRYDDNEEEAVNGDCQHSDNDDSTNPRNKITIKGKQENCEAAAKALQDLVPITSEMDVPYDLHRFIIGQKGKDVRNLMDRYDVSIAIPPQSEHSDVVVIKGSPARVEEAKAALLEKIEQLEMEKQDRLLRSFKVTAEVDPQYHPKIIGRGGSIINKIRKDFNVIINFPEREAENDHVITITGYEKDAEAAKEAILKLVQQQEDMYREEVEISARVHPRIIGTRGRSVNKIMDQFKVDIRFPRSSDPNPDIVLIQGDEDNVLDAKDHLLNLAEEYEQDLSERDFMMKYTQPPSRNGAHEHYDRASGKKGFVVSGAPWDKAPDTTNTQEFPSFGTAEVVPPRAPTVWGPTRR